MLVLALIAAPRVVFAEAATGELSLTITDSSGATIKDAQVTIAGTDTGATVRTLKSNEQGVYRVISA